MKSIYPGGKNTSTSFFLPFFFTTNSLVNRVFLILVISLLFSSTKIFAQLPDEFQKVDLVTGLANATTFKIAPDGRIFILDRYGELIIYKPSTQSTVSAGTLSVFSGLEDGLLGIAFDPDFETNGFIYLHYSPLATSVNRVSRFLMEGDDLNLGSEIVVLEWTTQRDNYFHAGGDIGFDSQGNLYIATGDNSNHSPYGLFNETDEDQSGENTASNTNDLRGKILRITPQPDGTYTIPTGNLFAPGTPNTLPEIYVMGARNPYRIHVDADFDDWLFWGEVGPDADVDGSSGEGPVGLDEMNLTKQAGNYGWPYFSGNGINDPNTVGGFDDSSQYSYLVPYKTPAPFYNDPSNPENTSVWNTGLTNLPAAQPSWLDFFHRSYMAGPRYSYDNSLTDQQRLPIEFDGHFFFYDFNTSRIWAVEMDVNGDIVNLEQVAPAVFPISQDGFIDMEIGPDGYMYVLAYGAGCCPNNVGTGRLMRIVYTGITSNVPPTVVMSADPDNGSLPLTVNFSSAGTFDPNGDSPLSYEWDFDTSVPSTDSTDENPTHIYAVAGTYNAQLRVDDGNGGIGTANMTIYAGNNRTNFTFNTPADGGFMNWGDDISLDLFASDVEDGDTDGNPGTVGSGIDCDDIVVVPSLGHLTHFHDTPAINGCPQDLTLGAEGHQTNGEADLFYVLTANYTDGGGLQSIDQIRIYPKRAEAEHYDQESGIEVIANTDAFGGGEEAIRVDNDSYVVLEGRNLLNITSIIYRVASTQSGGSIELHLDSPTGTLVDTSTVPVTGSLSTWVNVEPSITDPGGKHDLYFVFKNGSVSQNIFDLNYIEFVGPGVSVDNSPPVVDEVKSINTTQVQVAYNEYVTQATAEDLSNYSMDNGVSINSAVLQEDNRTVVLTTSTLTPDVAYNLTISGIQNIAGLTIVSNSYPFSIFTPIRINSGGGQLNTSYGLFEADQYAVGGEVFNNAIPIANTSDDVLYHSERYGTADYSYEIPVLVSGPYDIRLHFAEIFHGVGGNGGGPGSRVFNVSIEGNQVLTNFDILTETNPATALIKEFDDILISDGAATIEFENVVGDTKVSAIEILSPDAFTPTPSITILSPLNGWDVNQPFEVAFSTRNWTIAQGGTHMHYYIDGVMVGPHYSYDPIVIDGLSDGQHTIRLELFNPNHTGTGIFDEITVNVTSALTCNDLPFPDEWAVHELETDELTHRAVYIYPEYDLDGDGLKDIVTGAWWYKNPGSASGTWIRSTIGAPLNNVAHVYDFDGDGDMDLLGTQGTYESSDMAWAENDGSGGFTVYTNVPAGTNTFGEPFLAGIAGGVFEGSTYQIAINWNGAEATGDPMQLLTPPADPVNGTWTIETLSPDSLGEDINAGDIDGDGDLDLFQAGNWLENDLDNSGNWITHSTGITYATTFDRSQLVDIDRDGDLDAFVGQLGLGSDPDRYEFAWFEAPADPTQNWTKNVIATNVEGSLSVVAADMDFDGDLDVVVGEWLGNNELFGFENDLCDTGTWITNTIDSGGTGFDHHDGARVVDIDNDGDLDIVSIGWENIIPRIFENTTIDANDPLNEDPVVVNPGLQLLDEGSIFQLQIVADDPNAGDVLTYTATNLPAGLTIDSATGLISGTLTATPQSYSVNVRATDQGGRFDEESFTMIVGDFAPLIRINAGGPDVTFGSENWVEDIYFDGGGTFSTTDAIANTANDEIYQTERFSNSGINNVLTYEIPVPQDGTYGVRLHFAEIFQNAVGARVFDVDIENGQGVLTNYDIIAASGGAFTAVIETFLVNVTDGGLTISLTANIDEAKISGIELLGTDGDFPPNVVNPGDQTYFGGSNVDLQIVASDLGDVLTYSATGLPADLSIDATTGLISGMLSVPAGDYIVTVRATDQGGQFDEETFTITVVDFPNPLYINSGGPAVTFNDEEWIADQYFIGGSDDFSVTDPIAGTENDEIYQTERYGTTFSYEIPVPNDTEYEVTLHFAEIFHTSTGARVFDVDIENGQGQLTDYDIFVAAGNAAFTAVTESFIVTVNDGSLSIVLTSDVDFSKVSGISIVRRQPPTAVALANPEEGDAPLEVTFTGDQSTDDGTIVSYAWDFMDGNTSTDANPVHTFTDVGTYDVELTVTDDLGLTDTAIVTITVNEPNEPPVAVITADPLSGEAPLEVSFTGDQSTDDGTIVSYAWDFMDGNTSTDANPVHTFMTAGNYDVELTVTDDGGLTDTETVTIVVSEQSNEPPVAVIMADPLTGDAPLVVTFTGDQSTDDGTIVSYAWDFMDGNTSADTNPVHTFTAAGSYDVELTVTDDGGLTDTETVTIVVSEQSNEPPVAVVTADPLSGEAPLEVSFTGDQSTDDGTIVSYAWDFMDGNMSTDANPVHTFTAAGSYDVELTVTDDGGLTDTETVTIVVSEQSNEPPVAVVTADPLSGEAPLEVSFTGDQSTDDGTIVNYAWDFMDGNTSTDANPVNTFTDAGTYDVELTVTDDGGLTDTASITIVVEENDSSGLDAVAVIAPNPATDVARVILMEMPENVIVVNINLHDSTGRFLGSYNPQQVFANGAYEIPIVTLRDELYYITLELNQGEPIALRLAVNN